jgi:hypothetical protein
MFEVGQDALMGTDSTVLLVGLGGIHGLQADDQLRNGPRGGGQRLLQMIAIGG